MQRYWYAYTGKHLLLGQGNAVARIVDAHWKDRLLKEVETQSVPGVPSATFLHASMASLAMRRLGAEDMEPTAFASVGQVLALFDEADPASAAIDLLNGMTASAYAEGDGNAIARRIAEGFRRGELLYLPRDAGRLPELQHRLPGALAWLLGRQRMEGRAFAEYLRRGVEPVLSGEDWGKLGSERPIRVTWAADKAREDQLPGRRA